MGAGGRAAAPLQLGSGGGQLGGGGGQLGGGTRHLLLALLLLHSGQASSDTSGPVFIQVDIRVSSHAFHKSNQIRYLDNTQTIHVVLHRNLQTMSTSATQQV